MNIIIKLIIAVQILLVTGMAKAVPNQLMEQLLLDHSALVAAKSDYRMQRERGSLNGAEAADYAAYIAKLTKRVAEGCVQVAQKGVTTPPDIMCPSSSFGLVKSVPIDQGAEQTRAQKVAALDAELNADLGDFDELLLREQARVKAGVPRSSENDRGEGEFDGDGRGAAGGGENGIADTDTSTEENERQTRVGGRDKETMRGGGSWGGKTETHCISRAATRHPRWQ